MPKRPPDADRLAFRLAEILRRLNEGQTLTSRELVDEFGVTERTVRRDLHERFAFLDLVKSGDRYSLPPARLGSLTLQDIQRFAGLAGLQGTVPRLTTEFLREMLATSAHSALLMRGPAAEDVRGKERELEQLKQAIEARRLVSFEYGKADGSRKLVEAAPYKLVLHQGVWYLQATDAGRAKSYALTRVTRLLVLDAGFTPEPAVTDYLNGEDSVWLNVEKAEVVLKVAPPAAPYFERRPLISGQKVDKTLEDGSLIVSGPIAHPNQILPVVRYWLPHVRIISPEGLQAELESQLRTYLGDA